MEPDQMRHEILNLLQEKPCTAEEVVELLQEVTGQPYPDVRDGVGDVVATLLEGGYVYQQGGYLHLSHKAGT